MIKHPMSFVGGLLAGLCTMYFFDSQNGRRRRAALREAFAARRPTEASTVQGDDELQPAAAPGTVADLPVDDDIAPVH